MDAARHPARDAAALAVDRCLRRGRSLFVPSATLWTPERLDDLAVRLRRAAGRADRPGGVVRPFLDRWQWLLTRCDPDTVTVAAEILYLHLLVPTTVGAERKRALLDATLVRAPAAVSVPRPLDAALAAGIAPVGLAYTRRRLTQLAWLAAAAHAWRSLSPAHRRTAVAEPREAAAALADVPVAGGGPQRSALLHLLHPDVFPPVTSAKVRSAILRAFAAWLPADEPDPDLALAAVQTALSERHGPDASFFDPQIAARWQ